MIIPFNQNDEIGPQSGHKSGHNSGNGPIVLNEQELEELRLNGGWLSVSQFAQWSGQAKRSIKRHCQEKKYANLQRIVEGNGRRPYQINFTALPDVVRAELLRQVRGEKPMTSEEIAARDERFKQRTAQRSYNTKIALNRNAIVKHYLRFIGSEPGPLLERKQRWVEWYRAGVFTELVEVKEVISEVSWKTIDVWKKMLDAGEGDPYAMAPKYGASRGRRSVSPVEADALVRWATHPNCFVQAEVIRLAKRDLAARGMQFILSDGSLSRWLTEHRAKNYDLYTFARNGYKALNDRVLPSLRRDYGDIRPGDVLMADGHVLNADVINPETGKPMRMMLILVTDFATSMPLGWEIAPTENTAAICAAFERAIRKLGFVPKVIYVDNGKAFRSKHLNGSVNMVTAEEFSGLFDRLKPYGLLEVVNTMSYHGQSKPIERQFSSMHEFEKYLSSYRGNSIDNKVARLKRNEKFARQRYERLTSGITPTVVDVHYQFIEWLNEFVARPTSKGSHLGGVSPIEAFEAGMELVRGDAEYESRVVTPEVLRFLMMGKVSRSISQHGIKLFGVEYWADELYGYKNRSQKFVVRYDITDMRQVYVFDETGEVLMCEAKADVWSGHHPMARLLGNADDQQRLSDGLNAKRELEQSTIDMVKKVTKSADFYGAIERGQAMATVTVKALQEAKKNEGPAKKTGTDDAAETPEWKRVFDATYFTDEDREELYRTFQ